jgi:hypothetical protein
MRFMNQITLSYLMQGPNSTRESATKNYYFPMHILFSTIYLLQKKQLNHRNYSKQELSMEIFVSANNTDMNMYAKIQIICKHRYL